jgi:hypothetical protein
MVLASPFCGATTMLDWPHSPFGLLVIVDALSFHFRVRFGLLVEAFEGYTVVHDLPMSQQLACHALSRRATKKLL